MVYAYQMNYDGKFLRQQSDTYINALLRKSIVYLMETIERQDIKISKY